MEQTLAITTIRDYVCAECWGTLEWRMKDDEVVCFKYQDEHQGYVTKAYVEIRKTQDANDLLEASTLLKDLGVIANPHKGKTPDQLLDELGF